MTNKKYQTIDAGRAGSGNIDLSSGELEFVHEDTRSDSTVLPIMVSHVYLSDDADKDSPYGKGFKLNLQQKLIKVSEDGTRYDYYDPNNNKHEFEEKYYYKADGEKRYHIAGDPARDLRPEDITEEYDGRLFYVENPDDPKDQQIRHEVFSKLISKDGLVLQKGSRNFKGSERIDRRHEDVIKTEEEVLELKRTIQELGFMISEYDKFNSVYECGNRTFTYDDILTQQRELEDYAQRLEEYVNEIQSSKRSITKEDSEGRENQERMFEYKRKLQDMKIAFEEQEKEYLAKQNEIERYALELEKYLNELQSSKAPLIEDNDKVNQTKLLRDKRALLEETRLLYLNSRLVENDKEAKENNYSDAEENIINLKRVLEDNKLNVEKYALDLEEEIIRIQGTKSGITISDSGGRNNQQRYLELKEHLQGLKKNYDNEKEKFLSCQQEAEDYALDLEEHTLEIQSFRPSVSIEDSFDIIDDVMIPRESQEQMLEYKRALLELKNIYEIKEEERLKRQYAMQKETSEQLKKRYENVLELKEYMLKRLNEEIPVNFVIGKDGLILGFNRENENDEGRTGGILVAVFDSYQNQAAVTYEDGRITKIIDSDGKEVVLDYDGRGRLMSMVDFRDRRTSYEYDDEGRLINIIYQNKEKSRFEYDGGMIRMIPPWGSGPILEYNNGKVTKISSTKEELLRIEYPAQYSSTVIDIKTGTKVSYTFDDDGDCLFEYVVQNDSPKCLVTYDHSDNDLRCSFVLSKDKFDDNLIEHRTLNPFGNQIDGERVLINANGTAKAQWSVDVSKLDDHATDYMLYGFAFATSLPTRGRRETAYCSCSEHDDETIPENIRFELSARVEYNGDFDEFIVSFDSDRTSRQLAAIPVTLRERDTDDVIAVRPTAITITADYSDNQGIATFERPSLSVGDWTYSVFDAERNKIQEYISERISDKIENGNVMGIYKARAMKDLFYDDKNNLIREESIIRREEWSLDIVPAIVWQDVKTYVTSYEYNKQNKPIRTIDHKGMVSETLYDENGRAVRNVTYNRSNPDDKFYSETERSENGQVMAETDETGENKTQIEYAEGTNIVTKVTSPNGQTVSFGHDPHTDDVLGMSAVVDDIKNGTTYGYSKERTVLDCGNTKVEYIYDEWGRETSILLDSQEYVSFTYDEENDNDIVTATYANGEGYRTISDKFGKTLEVQHNDSGIYKSVIQNFYDDEDRLVRTIDLIAKEATNITYDKDGNVTKEICGDVEIIPRFDANRNRSTSVLKLRITEAKDNVLNKVVKEQSYTNNCDDEGEITSVELPDGTLIEAEKDHLNRPKTIETPISTIEYGYLQRDDHATNIVNRLVHKNKDGSVSRIRYFYDPNGNIKEIRDCGKLVVRYKYDGLDRLVREDNVEFDRTETYEYDNNGNILYRTVYPFSLRNVLNDGERTEYVYNGDRLIKAGEGNIDYNGNDLPGNPSSYLGRTLEWSHLRDLRKIDHVEFKYNANGIRLTKDNGNERTRYYWHGTRLLAERRSVTSSDAVWDMLVDEELPIYTDSKFIHYIQGSNGAIGFTVSNNDDHNGNNGDDTANEDTYYYQRNILGDVTHIYDSYGTLKARYVYDAWGNHKILDHNGIENNDKTFIGNINPIRYRGYYFDVETRLYYLQTRYYDPSTGRFINADSIDYVDPDNINGLNLYVYCGSNPIMGIDPSGHFSLNPLDWISNTISSVSNTIGNAFGSVANTLGGLYGGFVEFIQSDMGMFLIGGLIIVGLIALTLLSCGAASPLLAIASKAVVATVFKVAFGALIGATISAGTGLLFGGITDEGWSWNGAASGFMTGAITGAIAGGLSAGLGSATSRLLTMEKIGARGNALLGIGGNAGIGGGISAAQGLVTGGLNPMDVIIATAFGGIGGKVGLKYPDLPAGKEALIGFGLGFTEGGAGFAFNRHTLVSKIMGGLMKTMGGPINHRYYL